MHNEILEYCLSTMSSIFGTVLKVSVDFDGLRKHKMQFFGGEKESIQTQNGCTIYQQVVINIMWRSLGPVLSVEMDHMTSRSALNCICTILFYE